MAHKLLLADDEPDVLESTALLAESLGYEVVRVSQANEIFETAVRERPDVILQDLKMPKLNLAGLVAALRSEADTAEIPLVFYGAGRDMGATATRYDAWGYLTKPFGRGDMNRLLSQIFEKAPEANGRNIDREVKGLFHEILDHVTSVTNYMRVLELSPGTRPEEQRALRGAAESLLKLEVKLNGLRTYVTGLAAAIEPLPQWPTASGAHRATPSSSAEADPAAAPGSDPVASQSLPQVGGGSGTDQALASGERLSRPPGPPSERLSRPPGRPARTGRRDSPTRPR